MRAGFFAIDARSGQGCHAPEDFVHSEVIVSAE
jgi:hypothetical protein